MRAKLQLVLAGLLPSTLCGCACIFSPLPLYSNRTIGIGMDVDIGTGIGMDQGLPSSNASLACEVSPLC